MTPCMSFRNVETSSSSPNSGRRRQLGLPGADPANTAGSDVLGRFAKQVSCVGGTACPSCPVSLRSDGLCQDAGSRQRRSATATLQPGRDGARTPGREERFEHRAEVLPWPLSHKSKHQTPVPGHSRHSDPQEGENSSPGLSGFIAGSNSL